MKAAVYYEAGGPDVLRYEEVPDPECGPGTILVRVEVISIEGGDILHRAEGKLRSVPHIVGYQCAGTIEAVGPDVAVRQPGQRVVVTLDYGSHAELVAAASERSWLVPAGMDIRAAACVPIPFGTAHGGLFTRGRLQAGETVLVQGGAGGVGLAGVQLAKRAGATVIATASSDDKLTRLKQYGIDEGINYRELDFVAEVQRLTGGRGVDLVLDPVGSTVQQGLECLAFGGRLIWVGNSGRAPTTFDLRPLLRRSGSVGWASGASRSAEGRAVIDGYLKDVAKGDLHAVIDREYRLAEAAAAHAYIESRQAFGRVLLIP